MNVMPHIFMQVMRTLEKKWRSQGIIAFIYLDDILLLGPTKTMVQKHLGILIKDILEAGFKVNSKKSVLEPTQNIHHLGFDLNLQEGKLQISPQKLKMVKKELGKLVTKDNLSCRKMASILGQVRSFLVALPFLRAFTDTMCQFVNVSTQKGWNYQQNVPSTLKDQLKEIKIVLDNWEGRPFSSNPQQELHSDSSTQAWGGLDPKSGLFVKDFKRPDSIFHINVKSFKPPYILFKA